MVQGRCRQQVTGNRRRAGEADPPGCSEKPGSVLRNDSDTGNPTDVCCGRGAAHVFARPLLGHLPGTYQGEWPNSVFSGQWNTGGDTCETERGILRSGRLTAKAPEFPVIFQ